ncbi:hypothetical protein HDA32_005491 [Spinactinospora alkalitolerans]|uniref:ATPase AAA-type core domain-containing protein n=1 Tax=Spinactinospora alkalitolerans TaxID=687207 RepID=A0A852U2K9_9ACTN|nr:ATP-binding protein [Spinactinospora alkalitolerans]NYE50371.1 hypothetical protein [Spinactinospora alkalitolerans]
MLLSFQASNHRSLKGRQQLLLVPLSEPAAEPETEEPALPVAGIFGANASGKSNLLDAMRFMQRMVRSSMTENEPDAGIERFPFALRAASLTEPSTYAVELRLGGVRYTYGFSVDDAQVVWERLHSYPRGERRVVFERDPDGYRFGASLPGSMSQVKEITEDNALFLTVAARSRQEAVRPVYDWFVSRLAFRFAERSPASQAHAARAADGGWMKELEGLLRAADTGIERLELKRQEPTEGEIAEIEERYAGTPESFRRRRVQALGRVEVLFHHRAADSAVEPLGIRQQSHGTVALFELGQRIMAALRSGSVLVVDELDANMHSHLSAKLIELFENPATNPKGAQLVFSSHDIALLGWIRGGNALRREEVWFAEKDKEGASHLFPLSDYQDEGEANRALCYLTGRYGAVPEVADDEFDAVVARKEAAAAGPWAIGTASGTAGAGREAGSGRLVAVSGLTLRTTYPTR